ncbi:MAG: putative Ig domain-containing protein [Bryobacteraceae bacterium]
MHKAAALLLIASAVVWSPAYAQGLPPPTITNVSPSAVTAPSPGVTLIVTGTRFRQDSRVVWRFGVLGAAPLDTTFISETQLRASVPAPLLQDPAQIPIAVTQPGDPGLTLSSNVVTFVIFSGLSVATVCPLPNAIVGRDYSAQFIPNGGVPPYSWTLAGGFLPAGLTLGTNGAVTGIASVAQTTAFTVQVADAAGSTARSGCAVTSISPGPSQTLFITSLQPAGVVAGAGAVSLVIRGFGFTQTSIAVWNFGAGQTDLATTFVDSNTLNVTIPATLTANAGTFPVAVRQTVLTSQSVSNAQPFTVSAPLTIAGGCPLRDAVVGAGYSEQLTVGGGFAPYVWSVFAGQLPPGLALQREGTVSGTPNVAGEFNFTFAVTDSRNNSGTRACSMRVLGPIRSIPATLSFSAVAGGEWPGVRDLSIIAAAPNIDYSVSSSGGSWLRVEAASGMTPGLVRVSVDPSQLTAGLYGGVITIRADASSNQAVQIPVSLTLQPAATPALVPRPAGITFSAPRDGAAALTQLLTVAAAAPTAIGFDATALSQGNWLSVTPAGSATPGVAAALRVTASPAGLAPGTYSGVVRLSPLAGAARVDVPVTLAIGLSLETLSVSQSGVTITSVAGGPNPPNRTLHVASNGPNGFFWDAGVGTDSGGDWLELVRTANTARPGELSPAEFRARPQDLAAGAYFGDVRIATASADLPRRIGVVMEVLPQDRTLPLDLSAAALSFVAPTPAPRALTVRNLTRGATQIVTRLEGNTAIWSVTNAEARTLLSGESHTISVIANPAGLSPGVYRGRILLQSAGASAAPPPVQPVDLLLIVPLSDCAAAHPVVIPVAPGSGFRAAAGLPVAMEVDLIDACGRPVLGGAVSIHAPAAGGAGASLLPFGEGRYAGTWVMPDRDPGPATLTILAADGSGRAAEPVLLAAAVEANPGLPVVDAFVSGASFRVGAPVAPGGIVTAFGSRIAAAANPARSVPLPRDLGGTRLLVDGPEAAPLFFAGPGQLNAMLPFGLAPGNIHQVAVARGSMRSPWIDVTTAAAAPAVFMLNAAGQGIVVDGAQPSVVATPATPVARGGVVVIYCEGLGRTDAVIFEGQLSPTSPPANSVAPVAITIGGQPATVLFAGLTPESVGLYQINAVVPESIAGGDAVPIVVTAAGIPSRPVTIAVR